MATRKPEAARPKRARKDEVIRMRVTTDQKTALIAAAAMDGSGLSPWLLAVALRAARARGS